MACGFTLASPESLDGFKIALMKKFDEKTTDLDMSPNLLIDSEVTLKEVDWELFDILDKFKPFGMHNERPKYVARNLSVTAVEPLGTDGKHMKLMVRETAGPLRKTVGWRMCGENSDTNWCKVLSVGDKIDIVFEVDVNEWNGNRELQLTIIDLKKL
jgi:single-stranded-DNA-specific exonuclease